MEHYHNMWNTHCQSFLEECLEEYENAIHPREGKTSLIRLETKNWHLMRRTHYCAPLILKSENDQIFYGIDFSHSRVLKETVQMDGSYTKIEEKTYAGKMSTKSWVGVRFFGMSHLGAIFMAPLKYVCLFAAFTQGCIFTTLFEKKLFSLKLAHGNVFLCGRPHSGGLVFLFFFNYGFPQTKNK